MNTASFTLTYFLHPSPSSLLYLSCLQGCEVTASPRNHSGFQLNFPFPLVSQLCWHTPCGWEKKATGKYDRCKRWGKKWRSDPRSIPLPCPGVAIQICYKRNNCNIEHLLRHENENWICSANLHRHYNLTHTLFWHIKIFPVNILLVIKCIS